MSATGIRFLGLVLFAGLICWVSLVIYAFRQNSQERDTLCLVLYAYVARSTEQPKKGAPGYSYYQAHLEELQSARARDGRLLAELPCSPEAG